MEAAARKQLHHKPYFHIPTSCVVLKHFVFRRLLSTLPHTIPKGSEYAREMLRSTLGVCFKFDASILHVQLTSALCSWACEDPGDGGSSGAGAGAGRRHLER